MDKDKQYGLPDEEYYMLIDEKIRKRREERLEKKRRAKRRLIIRLSILAAIVGLIIFSFSSFFTITSIMVQGNNYFTADEIIAMSHAEPGSNIIYHPGIGEIESYLKENPYISDVNVKRVFPATLVIEVEEREQVAALVYDDDYLIISEEGILLRKTETEPKITLIEGVKVSKIELGEKIESTDERVLQNTLSLLNAMRKGDLYFKKIVMSDLYVNAYIYDAFMCKGTEEYLEKAINSNRLHKIIEDLFSKNIKRGMITVNEDGYASFVPSVE